MIYLDNASTTRVDSRVLEVILPYFTKIYGNASSSHKFGKMSQNAIDKARVQVSEIILTSGSTEPINLTYLVLADTQSNASQNQELNFATQ
jgi:cysteine desulfurase